MWLVYGLASVALAQNLPSVSTETLAGDAIELPSGLKADRTVLVISFEREHQEVSNAWRPHLSSMASAGKVDWLELPFMDVSTPMQLVISTAMKATISDDEARSHIAVVWSSADSVRSALGISSADEVAIVVVDKAGALQWKGSGAPTDANVAAVKAALAK
ncbi:MAG: hypothetical protein KTR31_26630 [Myxococcales bacterium]|nr:hypothetical protein [Myxococcales bacterium]